MIFMKKKYFSKRFFGSQCLSTASLLIFQHFLQITARSVLTAIFFRPSNYCLLRNTAWHIYLHYVTVMAVHVQHCEQSTLLKSSSFLHLQKLLLRSKMEKEVVSRKT